MSPTLSPDSPTEEPTNCPTAKFENDNKCVGIWDLSGLDENFQTKGCLHEMLKLAETIGKSKKAKEGWKKVTKDGKYPKDSKIKIEFKDTPGAWAQYEGDAGGKEDTI